MFGNSSSNPAGNNASGGSGLFGNTAAQSGFKFGGQTSNSTVPKLSLSIGNNNNNNNTSGGVGTSLFGNNASTTGTQFGGNKTGIFGANNATGTNATNNGTTTSLFGSNTGTNTSTTTTSLFGNTSNSGNTGAIGGLFNSSVGNNNSNNKGGLFGNTGNTGNTGGLFGNNTGVSNTMGNNGLFGNNMSANMNPVKVATLNDSPYGLLFNVNNVNDIKEMPKPVVSENAPTSADDSSASITMSPKNAKLKSLRSANSSSPLSIASTTQKQKLGSSIGLSSMRGLFSSKDNMVMNLTPAESKSTDVQDTLFSTALEEKYSSKTFDFKNYESNFQFNAFFNKENKKLASNSNSSSNNDIKKLIIDPDLSAAKRRKMLGGGRSDVHTDNIDDLIQEEMKREDKTGKKRYLSFSLDVVKSKLKNRPIILGKTQKNESLHKNLENELNFSKSPKGYWCSPPISKLSKMSLSQLSSVSNFIVGRLHYGQIAFNQNVDLSDFASLDPDHSVALNLYNSLLTEKYVVFSKNRVEVYPDENTKPSLGRGVNVESLITIENCFPKNVEKFDDSLSSDVINNHIRKLKRQKEMEFVNYVASSGSWTFKVPHFSIWGLIDDSDDEIEDGEDATNPEKPAAPPASENPEKLISKPAVVDTRAETAEGSAGKVEKVVQQNEPATFVSDEVMKLTEFGKAPRDISIDEIDKFSLKRRRVKGAIPGGWNFNDDAHDVEQIESESKVETPLEKSADSINVEVESSASKTDSSIQSEQNALVKAIEPEDTQMDLDEDYEKLEELRSSIFDTQFDSDSDNYDIVEERPYEPTNISAKDIEVLEVDTTKTLAKLRQKHHQNESLSSESWADLFEECNTEESVFNPQFQQLLAQEAPKLPVKRMEESVGEAQYNLDSILFNDLNQSIAKYHEAQKQLRISKKGSFVCWDVCHEKLIRSGGEKQLFKYLPLKNLFNNVQGIENTILKVHFNHSEIVARPNGIPRVIPNENLDFKFICETFSANEQDYADFEEFDYWYLASVLFDESRLRDESSYNEIQSCGSSAVQNRMENLLRIEMLQNWLKPQVAKEMNSNTSDDLENVFSQLCQFNIQKASKFAHLSRNFHLATIITLLDSNDPNVKFGAQKQLDYWKSNSSDKHISSPILKVYKLLGGDFLNPNNHPEINVTENLSWKAVLLMLLSYGDVNKPLHVLLREFFTHYVDVFHVEINLSLGILKLHSLLFSEHIDFQQVTNTLLGLTHGSSFDVRVCWYTYEILLRSNAIFKGDSFKKVCLDKVTVQYAEQLLLSGSVDSALFILIHLDSDLLAEHYLNKVVCQSIDNIVDLTDSDNNQVSSSDKISQLINEFKIPKKLVATAISYKYHYLGLYFEEAYALLEAEDWDKADAIIKTEVAPKAVIGGGELLKKLLALLNKFPTSISYELQDWSKGLAVYKNYALLMFNQDQNDDFKNSLFENLKIHLPLMEKENFEIKVACTIMEKFVARLGFGFADARETDLMEQKV